VPLAIRFLLKHLPDFIRADITQPGAAKAAPRSGDVVDI
jgi:hypothetical protein